MTVVQEKMWQEGIVDLVRRNEPVMTSENNAELARRIGELSAEFLVKNKDLYKRLETR